MKTSRIDLIALNGATGEHYKYEEVADKIGLYFFGLEGWPFLDDKVNLIKILVEHFDLE